MKTMLTFIVLIGIFSSAALGDTTNKNDSKSRKTVVEKKAKPESDRQKGGSYLTGSYIKQDIRRGGRITDGMNQVIVLDRDTIERSGASDVRQLLVHQGVH